MTQRQVDEYLEQTGAIKRRVTNIRSAVSWLSTAEANAAGADSKLASLTSWRDHLTSWRKTLCDELLAMPHPRDRSEIYVSRTSSSPS